MQCNLFANVENERDAKFNEFIDRLFNKAQAIAVSSQRKAANQKFNELKKIDGKKLYKDLEKARENRIIH